MKKYSVYLIAGIFVVLIFVSAFNWLINPYDIFLAPEIKGLNRYKVDVGRHTRLSKIYQIERIKPEAVLLASSRGLVIPESYFSSEGMTGFNLALSSASTYELLRVLQHAQATHPLKRVVLALDEEFTETRSPNFSEDRLSVDLDGSLNKRKWLQRLNDTFSSLVSIDALRSSVRTMKMQKFDPVFIDERQYEYERIERAGGHRQMFRTMESSIFSKYHVSSHSCQMSYDEPEDQVSESIKYFERIVELAHANGINLYIYFSPSHARLNEANCMVGNWLKIEEMKRRVVRVVENEGRRAGVAAYPIWDFSGYNSITTEAVPVENDVLSKMKWYLEGSHYTRETAKLVLDKILSNSTVPIDFGIKLTSNNIEKHLNDIRDKRKLYLKTHKGDIEELYSLLVDVRR